MTTILVWYFLSGHSTAAVIGPFQTQAQCESLREQNRYLTWNKGSDCWQAPLAVVRPPVEECHAKVGCD